MFNCNSNLINYSRAFVYIAMFWLWYWILSFEVDQSVNFNYLFEVSEFEKWSKSWNFGITGRFQINSTMNRNRKRNTKECESYRRWKWRWRLWWGCWNMENKLELRLNFTMDHKTCIYTWQLEHACFVI